MGTDMLSMLGTKTAVTSQSTPGREKLPTAVPAGGC